jgi:hypothetical protein
MSESCEKTGGSSCGAFGGRSSRSDSEGRAQRIRWCISSGALMTAFGPTALRFGAAIATHASRAAPVVRAPKHYVFTGISPMPVASIVGCVVVLVGLGAGLCLMMLSRPRRRPAHRRRVPPEPSGAAQRLHGFRMTMVEEDPLSHRGAPLEGDVPAPTEPAAARR